MIMLRCSNYHSQLWSDSLLWGFVINLGKTLFAQLMEFVPRTNFARIVVC